MKTFTLFFLVIITAHTSSMAQNPTALWEFRDSLRSQLNVIERYPSILANLEHIEEVNTYLKRIRSIIPFPAIKIDVVIIPVDTKNVNEFVGEVLKKNDYDVIAMDSRIKLSNEVHKQFPSTADFFHDSVLTTCIAQLNETFDPNLRYCRSLAIKVHCEIALAHIAYALKGFRDSKGGYSILSGALIIREPIDMDHVRKIFQLFNVNATIISP